MKLSNLFHVDPNEFERFFVLEDKELYLYYSLLNSIVTYDISNEDDSGARLEKSNWQRKWNNSISSNDWILQSDLNSLVNSINNEVDTTKPKFYKVLADTMLFIPYYKLDNNDSEIKSNYLKNRSEVFKRLCDDLSCNYDLILSYLSKIEEAPKSFFKSHWGKVTLVALGSAALLALTGGAAAPLIGAEVASIFGVGGLAGAAAVSHGLAMIGLGSMAAGGFGVAGGTAIIVGGGGLIGGIAGGYFGNKLLDNNDVYKLELKKLSALIEVKFFNEHYFNENKETLKAFILERVGKIKLKDETKKEEALLAITKAFEGMDE